LAQAMSAICQASGAGRHKPTGHEANTGSTRCSLLFVCFRHRLKIVLTVVAVQVYLVHDVQSVLAEAPAGHNGFLASISSAPRAEPFHTLSWKAVGLLLLWNVLTFLRTRNILSLLVVFPQYAQTLFYFSALTHPGVTGLVALTIDDGICRHEPQRSMLGEVLSLLSNHSAHATFFLNSNSLQPYDLERLVEAGQEVANHMPADSSYVHLDEAEFEEQLRQTDRVLAPFVKRRWFRAPGGRLTKTMATVLNKLNVTSVLGDCYADDWCIEDPERVAALYLRQVDDGSIAIMHMPEKGFREHTLELLSLLLAGFHKRGLAAVTMSELYDAAFTSAAPHT